VFHSITKYIDVQYHFIQEVVEDESVDLIKTHTRKNLTDVLIKLVNIDKYIWCRSFYDPAKR
jgi:hypothetical protein